MAKESKKDQKLALRTPVVEVTKSLSESVFEGFIDHFRYVWDLDVTLDLEDATHFSPGRLRSITKYKQPHSITFASKANRLCDLNNLNDEDFKIATWKRQVSNHFQKVCADLSPSLANETIFITCSWKKENDSLSTPNNYAQVLNRYLHEDFVNIDAPMFSVQIMQATPSEFLSNQLYQTLDSTTMGLVIMSKDIKEENGSFYCKPNIYHELGYLMKQLGKKRLIVLRENEVETPSNIQDIIRLDFDENKITFRYHDILVHLATVSNIPRNVLQKAVDNHLGRLTILLEDEVITLQEYQALKNRTAQVPNIVKQRLAKK